MRAIAERQCRAPPKSAKKAPRELGLERGKGASRARLGLGGEKLDAPSASVALFRRSTQTGGPKAALCLFLFQR
jgi:hypothetical protein